MMFVPKRGHTFAVLALVAIAAGLDAPLWDKLLPDQACVVKDGPASYKLYYAGEDFLSINLATSADGLVWTEHPGNPIIVDGQYHATVHYYVTAFAGANVGTDPSAAPMRYRIWYAGPTNYGIGNWRYGESQDGVAWHNRVAVTQVVSAPLVWSASVGVAYGIADAVHVPGAANAGVDWSFRIYANVQWESGPHSAEELVIAGFSANGYEWFGYDPTSVGYATPVFASSHAAGDFDRAHIGWWKVIRNAATDWEAFYSGGNETTYARLNGVGRAASTDGFNWTRTGALVTTADGVAWRNMSVWMPSVVAESAALYRIYFLGSNRSPDGGSWIWWKLGCIGYVELRLPKPPSHLAAYIAAGVVAGTLCVALVVGAAVATVCWRSKPAKRRRR